MPTPPSRDAGPVHVYGLFDPLDGVIRYVGRTTTPATRLAEHRRGGGRSGGGKCITNSWSAPRRRRLQMQILETAPWPQRSLAEGRWIAVGGPHLENIHRLGGGSR